MGAEPRDGVVSGAGGERPGLPPGGASEDAEPAAVWVQIRERPTGGTLVSSQTIRRDRALVSCLVAILLAPAVAHAQPPGFEKFYGEWVGEAVSETGGEVAPRDIRAKIAPEGKGFSVTWIMVVHKASGKDKRTEQSIKFLPTSRPGVYSSAMRVDMFGNAKPLDPLRGDPYMWARTDGATLRIYALIITDSGGYEMHLYERALTPTGMSLKFSRVHDGEVLRTITGTLKRAQ